MNIRTLLKKSEMIVGLRNDLLKLQRFFHSRLSTNALNRYIRSNHVRKLQIGAGPIALPGWLGTDLSPTTTVVFLDATRAFPMEDCTFDYIHTEHMIEHINWFEGMAMLRECFRILKPDGRIRVATPDLKVYAGLYTSFEGSFGAEFINWITDRYLQGIPEYRAGFVINSIFYRWGHKFVFDQELLSIAMREAGFIDIKRYAPGASDDVNLQGIEMHGEIGNYREDMNTFETLVLEGMRPR